MRRARGRDSHSSLDDGKLRNTREIEFLVENWKNEKDAALVYRQMADQERNAQRREILLELASTEEEHARVWAEELSKRGIKVLEYRPRLRAKIYLWLMKRLGVRSILQALEGVEKGAASGYLQGTAIVTDPKLKEKIAEVAPVEQSHSRILAALDGRAQRQTPHEILRGERWHRGGGSIRDLIFGMNDGLLSTFSLVTGVAGATASNQIILLSGIAGAVAGAISMTAGAYVSTKAEREVSEKHVEMERLELTMMPQQEENELALIYRLKGLSSDQARSIARTLLRDEATALETMSREELGFDIEELPDPKTAALASGLIRSRRNPTNIPIPSHVRSTSVSLLHSPKPRRLLPDGCRPNISNSTQPMAKRSRNVPHRHRRSHLHLHDRIHPRRRIRRLAPLDKTHFTTHRHNQNAYPPKTARSQAR